MEVATVEQGRDFIEQAKKWMASAPNAGMFNDCKSITRSSVAEYIANQNGYTLWPLNN